VIDEPSEKRRKKKKRPSHAITAAAAAATIAQQTAARQPCNDMIIPKCAQFNLSVHYNGRKEAKWLFEPYVKARRVQRTDPKLTFLLANCTRTGCAATYGRRSAAG
jgi:hypothetical protein